MFHISVQNLTDITATQDIIAKLLQNSGENIVNIKTDTPCKGKCMFKRSRS